MVVALLLAAMITACFQRYLYRVGETCSIRLRFAETSGGSCLDGNWLAEELYLSGSQWRRSRKWHRTVFVLYHIVVCCDNIWWIYIVLLLACGRS